MVLNIVSFAYAVDSYLRKIHGQARRSFSPAERKRIDELIIEEHNCGSLPALAAHRIWKRLMQTQQYDLDTLARAVQGAAQNLIESMRENYHAHETDYADRAISFLIEQLGPSDADAIITEAKEKANTL
jgi:hypothetical protein